MRAAALLPLFALAAAPASAHKDDLPRLATLPPATETRSLLDGRLDVQVPASVSEAIGPPRTDESRIAVNAGAERLEIRATELFAIAGTDFLGAARRVVDGWGSDSRTHVVEAATLASGLSGVDVVPAGIQANPTGAFVRGLFVRLPDGTVQYLEARANAEAARDLRAADALATRILHSVASGGRRITRDAASWRLVTPLAGITVFANTPDGVGCAAQREPDRTVHRLQAFAPLGENAPSLTVTFSKDGRYLHDRLSREIKPAVREGRLFGEKVLWHEWSSPGTASGKKHLEALVTLGTPAQPLTAHVLVLHRTGEQAENMRALAESLIAERRPE